MKLRKSEINTRIICSQFFALGVEPQEAVFGQTESADPEILYRRAAEAGCIGAAGSEAEPHRQGLRAWNGVARPP